MVMELEKPTWGAVRLSRHRKSCNFSLPRFLLAEMLLMREKFLLLSVLGVGQALTTIGLPNQKQLDDEHKRWLAEDRLGTYEQDE